jgi:hypothetical protein
MLWLAGACLLFLPGLASAAQPCSGPHLELRQALHAACHGGVTVTTHPVHKKVDDNDDDESDDLIGDTWLAPCALPECGARASLMRRRPEARQPECCPAIRSFAAADPFAPRPPPARFLL